MALRIQALQRDAVFAVLPSDHIILKEDVYTGILSVAFDFAQKNDALVTLGIQPSRPDTGYGYIRYNKDASAEYESGSIHRVMEFKEKPDEPTAIQYVSSRDYLWNAGMFVWSVGSIMQSFKKNAPAILDVLTQELHHFGTDNEQEYINRVYPGTENITIDYAILERADNVFTIPADIGWSDLGTWNSLHAYFAVGKDTVSIGHNIHMMDCKDTIVMSNNDKTIVIRGLRDYFVVDEDIDMLQTYWTVYPSMWNELFDPIPDRPGYYKLTQSPDRVRTFIMSHKEYNEFNATLYDCYNEWSAATRTHLFSLEMYMIPKRVIQHISEQLLSSFSNAALIDKYDIYQHLMDYWNQTMQDDFYLVTADGWKAELKVIKQSKSYTEYDCELLPKSLIIDRYFEHEKQNISDLQSKSDTLSAELDTLVEEHNGEDGYFAALDKINKNTVAARLKYITPTKVKKIAPSDIAADPEQEYGELAILRQYFLSRANTRLFSVRNSPLYASVCRFEALYSL